MSSSYNSSPSRNPVKHVSDIIGDWGPVPRRIFWFLFTCYTLSPYYSGAMLFINSDPDFDCVDERAVAFGNGSSSPYKQCTFIDRDGHSHKCEDFKFNTSHSLQRRSLIDDFSLVCHRSWLLSVVQSSHQVGIMIAALAFGVLSDISGRVTALKASMAIELIVGLAQAFSPNIWFYLVTRVLMGVAIYGRYINGYVLLIEWIGPTVRGKIPIFLEFGFIIGDFFVPAVFYLVSDFRVIQGVTAGLLVIWFLPLVCCRVLPESSRWQMTRGRYEDAQESIVKAARMSQDGKVDDTLIIEKFNRLKESMEKELERESKNSTGMLSIFKYPHMVKVLMILCYSWMSHAFISYASYYNMGSLQVNLYLLYFILSLSYCVSTIFLFLSMNYSSRSTLLKMNILIEVLSFIGMLSTAFSTDFTVLTIRVIFAFTAWASVGNSFNLLYIYSAEVFPTPVRQSSMGICSFVARLGSIMAPFVRELTVYTHLSVPIALYGVLAVVNLVLVFFIPDMDDKEIPDTFDEQDK